MANSYASIFLDNRHEYYAFFSPSHYLDGCSCNPSVWCYSVVWCTEQGKEVLATRVIFSSSEEEARRLYVRNDDLFVGQVSDAIFVGEVVSFVRQATLADVQALAPMAPKVVPRSPYFARMLQDEVALLDTEDTLD